MSTGRCRGEAFLICVDVHNVQLVSLYVRFVFKKGLFVLMTTM